MFGESDDRTDQEAASSAEGENREEREENPEQAQAEAPEQTQEEPLQESSEVGVAAAEPADQPDAAVEQQEEPASDAAAEENADSAEAETAVDAENTEAEAAAPAQPIAEAEEPADAAPAEPVAEAEEPADAAPAEPVAAAEEPADAAPEAAVAAAVEVEASEPAAEAEEASEEQKPAEKSEEEDEDEKKPLLQELDPERAALPWYAVHTYSGYENRVKLSLEERVRSASLERKFGNIVVPHETVEELVRGKKKQSSRKLFPGYIMVQMHLDDETWHLLNATPKVTGFVGDSRKPLPLTEREVKELMAQIEGGAARPRPRVQFEEGDAIKVIDGPFSDFNGTVDEVRPDKGKLRVLISIFGRNTPVELDFVQVEKM